MLTACWRPPRRRPRPTSAAKPSGAGGCTKNGKDLVAVVSMEDFARLGHEASKKKR